MKRVALVLALVFGLVTASYAQMDALRTLAASLDAGEIGVLNTRGDASGWGPNVDNPVTGIRQTLSQASKCEWDPTPWRGHHTYQVNGAHSALDTTIDIDTGTEPVVPGMVVNFRGVSGEYEVTVGIPAGGAGTITITPGVAEALADNTGIAMMKRGERIIHLGNSHTSQVHSWPGWSIYEVFDGVWKNPHMYRAVRDDNPGLPDPQPDPFELDLTYGWFHQNAGLAFNSAKQFLYRFHPGGNPTIMNRVYTGEYNPMDIGRLTPFALGGTLTFANQSYTVTCSGAACDFTGQLQPGYQIWLDAEQTLAGSPIYIVTVESIESDTSLTLVNAYFGTASPGSASAWDPTDLLTHWSFEPGGAISSASNLGAIEYWPEKDSIFMLDSRSGGTGGLYAKRTLRGDSAAWQTILTTVTSPALIPINNTGFVNMLLYNPVRKKMLIGIGIAELLSGVPFNGVGGAQFWEVGLATPSDPLNSGYTLTALDSYTASEVHFGGGPSGDLVTYDPITGHYLLIITDLTGFPSAPYPNNDYIFLEINPDASTGNQITSLDSSALSAHELSGDGLGQITAFVTACAADSLGGVILLGGDHTYFYKHTANTRAQDGMTTAEKRALGGVLGYVPFGEPGLDLKYAWHAGLEAVYPPLATAMSGETNYAVTEQRLSTEGNFVVTTWPAFDEAPRSDDGDGVGKGIIDTTTTYKGEPGALRQVTKNQTGQSTSKFVVNIDGSYGGISNEKQISPTLNAIASTLTYQYAARADANLLLTYPGHYPITTFVQSFVSTTGVDSAVVNLDGNDATMAWINKQVYVDLAVPGVDVWIPGIYTIVAVPAANQIELNQSPTEMGTQGTNGFLWVQEDATDSLPATKMAIMSGKPPSTDSSAAVEMALTFYNRGECPRYLAPYQQNGPGLSEETCYGGPLEANTWHLITWDFDFRPIQHRFFATATDSAFVSSSTITFDSSWALSQASYLWISGFGPNSYAVNASNCVPGLYQILSYRSSDNSIELDRSFSKAGTAATECEAYLSTGFGALDQYSRHNVRVWKDRTLVVEMNFRAGFAINTSFFADPGEELGLGNVSFNWNGNFRDVTFEHPDAYGWYSQPIFSILPLARDTASATNEPPPSQTSGPARRARLRR